MAKSKPKLVHVTWDSAFSGALQASHRFFFGGQEQEQKQEIDLRISR
jgi:hypothetical protein